MANPFVHVELNTTDLEAAKRFYSQVFDWKLSDMPMGEGVTYTMIDPSGGVGGGMATQQTAGAPSAWLSYVGVSSVRDTIAKAREAGANVIVEYMPVGDMGALGIFIDPTGAMLGLWESNMPPPAPAPAKKGGKKKAAKKSSTKGAKKGAKKPAKKGGKKRR